MRVHGLQRKAQREAEQPLQGAGRSDGRQARVRDLLRDLDIEVQPEWRCNLILEELSQAAMPWIDTAQQFALVETKGEGVIGLPRSRLPRGLLTVSYTHLTL